MDQAVKLNKEQAKAVKHDKGPLLIVAGAGTGKTRVVTERIKWLLETKKAKPSEILALTFTEKAAGEMLSRVDEAMPLGYEEPWLSTFHSFCDRLLREEALEIGLDPTYKILTAAEAWIFFRQHLFDFDLSYYRPLGNPTKFISAVLTLFSRAQDEDVSPEEFSLWAKSKTDLEAEKWLELAKAFKKYQKLKIANSKLDFGDLILWVLKLFRERPNILAKYQKQFRSLLVDEFQDTNFAQYQLIKLLAPAKLKPNLMVVGCDDQAIYKFRGASVTNILSFKKDYPEAETIVLTKNYRSAQPILDASYRLIQNNNPDRLEAQLGISKKLKAYSAPAGKENHANAPKETLSPLKIMVAETGEEETALVVRKIMELAKRGCWQDFAILSRANNHLDPFVVALRGARIPYQLLGNRGLFDQEEVQELIAALRLLADPEEDISLYRLLNGRAFAVAPENIIKLLRLAKRERKPLWQILLKEGGERERELANTLVDLSSALGKKTVSRLLYDFVTESGFLRPFLEKESLENELKVKNINLFLERVKRFEAENENATIFEFVNYLDFLAEAGENPAQAEIEDIDTVNLLTVHGAKGLEFPVVFLVNLVSDRFPTRRRGDPIPLPEELVKEPLLVGDTHLEEERRLLYVGLTRAKERVFLTYAKNYGGKREKKPSGFIGELGLKPSSVEQPSLFHFPPKEVPPPKLSRETRKKQPSFDYVSYSQLETFKSCPLKYKYRYVLSIPTLPSHILSFGQTIHRTLRDFHQCRSFNQKSELDYLLELYGKHWLNEGYESRKHRESRFKEGQEVLRNYYQEHKKHLAKPVFLEKKFCLKIGSTTLLGSIDRIDRLETGEHEVIDYKTGRIKEQKEVESDEQLTIYALAALESLDILPQRLSLYFVEGNVKLSTTRNQEELKGKREDITRQIEEIRLSDFPAKPSKLCRFCDYRRICPSDKANANF